ncbi:MAG: beta-propeller domain-containing protein [Alphaproteobacteria bacterium]|nr:beta-propeller domain-containing protein [Alphaproteobacteria bacterium]MBL6937968.1 beta-propeller domain-containing protein [Alphaproteobacteria bacterium]MBL7099207.1 beta-propeller domain-containing protein [Alphaproteobacteria bacterium]
MRHATVTAASIAALLSLTFASTAAAPGQPAHRTLIAFQSDTELAAYLKKLARQRVRRAAEEPMADAAMAPPPPPSPAAGAETVVASGAAGPSITNNQEAGVDEGDIVKMHGRDTMVILRRGRLFTISLANGGMKPTDMIDAYPPGVNASSDWYDEMLVSGDRVIVIGYSYSRGGTQVNRFRISADGHLAFEDAYQLRSNDYYSSRNYASRLVGHTLVFYSPRYIGYGDPLDALPGLRKWNGNGDAPGWRRVGTAREVFQSPGIDAAQVDTVHTIMSCDLTAPQLACKATSVLGPGGRTFYVSSHAVYVWVTPWWSDARDGNKPSSLLYRLPLDGGAPSAVATRGAPVDQFSFREDGSTLSVLVRANSAGDVMWAPEHSAGAIALLRVSADEFGDGSREAARTDYRGLPSPRDSGDFHNRFVGNYILYGNGNGWGTPQDGTAELIAAPLTGGSVTTLTMAHGIDRIEVMGRDAMVVGSDQANVTFSTIDLGGRRPAEGSRYVLEGAAQAETRSHGFFYRPDADPDSGVLGLPVSMPANPAYRQLFDTSAAMTFLRRSDGQLSPLGQIAAHDAGAVDDHCVASCVDWYGNARPIFLGNRIFALMGYELVEGAIGRDRIHETGRVNYTRGGGRIAGD